MKNDHYKSLSRKLKRTVILALFTSVLIFYLHAAGIQCEWTSVERIVAVGDLHGDYENFVKILNGTKLINEELHWTGGKTHLVQIGDILDRGPDAKEIFNLLMRLEKEAEEAGGKVHALIGNHEEMNISGIAIEEESYVTLEQFLSFLPDEYRESQEKRFNKKSGAAALKEKSSDSSSAPDLRPYWQKILSDARRDPNHPARRKYTNTFNEKYGTWILKNNAVIKINDIIFVHGGISEEFSTQKLEDINDRLRLELEDLRWATMNSRQPKIPQYQRKIVYNTNGPLWFRDLAQGDENLFKEDVDRILKNLDAHYMVTAHTPLKITDEEHMKRFGGRVWIIDTGISKAYGGHLSALIIKGGKFSAWPPSLRSKKSDSKGVNDEIKKYICCLTFCLLYSRHWGPLELARARSGKHKTKRTGELPENRKGCA